jgi:hypothetical protein
MMSAEQASILRNAAAIVYSRGEYDLSFQLQKEAREIDRSSERETTAKGAWD